MLRLGEMKSNHDEWCDDEQSNSTQQLLMQRCESNHQQILKVRCKKQSHQNKAKEGPRTFITWNVLWVTAEHDQGHFDKLKDHNAGQQVDVMMPIEGVHSDDLKDVHVLV